MKNLLVLVASMLWLPIVAQNKKGTPNKRQISENRSDVRPRIKVRPDSIAPFIIAYNGDTINKTDNDNLKQGPWILKSGGDFDEPLQTIMGNYVNGKKFGHWKTYQSGQLISDENYFNNSLDGQSNYYDNGILLGTANFYASHSRKTRDTIIIKNPINEEEKVVVLKTENTSYRDGEWRYYNPINGRLRKIEIYLIDELIKEEFINPNPTKSDVAKSKILIPHTGTFYQQYRHKNSSPLKMDKIEFVNKKEINLPPNWKF